MVTVLEVHAAPEVLVPQPVTSTGCTSPRFPLRPLVSPCCVQAVVPQFHTFPVSELSLSWSKNRICPTFKFECPDKVMEVLPALYPAVQEVLLSPSVAPQLESPFHTHRFPPFPPQPVPAVNLTSVPPLPAPCGPAPRSVTFEVMVIDVTL